MNHVLTESRLDSEGGQGTCGFAKPVLIVSDVHLGVVDETTEVEFQAFLDYAAQCASGLLINGDLFEVFIASRHFVVRHHLRTLVKLADVVQGGVPVWFVGGNHDALEYSDSILEHDLGLVTLQEPAELRLGRYRALIVHGDGARPGRSVYRKRHPILRSRIFRRLAGWLLPMDVLYDAAARVSETPVFVARHRRGEDTGPKPAAPIIEAWAREQLGQNSDVDLVLAGHSHLPAWVETAPGRYYVNTGDWISHMTYAVIPATDAPPEVRRWPTHEVVLPRAGASLEST